jgi:hypothetical protein
LAANQFNEIIILWISRKVPLSFKFSVGSDIYFGTEREYSGIHVPWTKKRGYSFND